MRRAAGWRVRRLFAVGALTTFGVAFVASAAWAGPEAGPTLTRGPVEVVPSAPEPACTCYTCECRKPAKPKCPTKYENLRFLEDWSACRCVPVCDRGDATDVLKPVGRGWLRVDVGGQVRFRFEAFENPTFDDLAENDDNWMLGRFRVHANVHAGDHLRVFVEGIYADQWGRDTAPRPIDVNQGDLLNAFVEADLALGAYHLGAAVGRRELQEGKQRLVSPLDWANTRRTFQGAYGWVERAFHRVDLFYTRPVVVDPFDLDEWDEDTDFYGVYYSNRVRTCVTWEAYALGLDRDAGRYLAGTEDEERWTIGGRVGGELPNTRFDYDLEGGVQVGTWGDEDILAGFVSLEAGWRPCTRCLDPRLALGFDYATGDRDDGRMGTFNQLYPLGHAYLGYADLIGRQNLIAGRVTGTVAPVKDLTLRADVHAFWRDSLEDAVYNAAGGVLRAPGGSRDRFTGSELDLSFTWTPQRHLKVEGGWCHFFTGPFIEATGPGDDVDFFYLSTQYTF